jgi:type IV secretory pathway TrbF-like protein
MSFNSPEVVEDLEAEQITNALLHMAQRTHSKFVKEVRSLSSAPTVARTPC